MNNSELLQAFFNDVQSWATVAVDYGGREFSQPNGYWLQLSRVINDIDPDLTGDDLIKRGIFQINVCCPRDRSIVVLSQFADDVQQRYKKGDMLGDVKITTAPRQQEPIYDDSRIFIPVYFSYSQ